MKQINEVYFHERTKEGEYKPKLSNPFGPGTLIHHLQQIHAIAKQLNRDPKPMIEEAKRKWQATH